MNNKGQLNGLIFFILIVVALVVTAPIILKVGLNIMDQTSNQFAQVDSSNQSANLVTDVRNTMTDTIDWVVILLILFNILLILITSFLVDIHPAFLILYIIGCFLLVITAPYTMAVAEKIYSMDTFISGDNNVIQYIPMTEFILNNFGLVIVGVIILSGIIMYAKIKLFSSGGGTGTSY